MLIGSVCLSHSPLKDSNRTFPETESRFDSAIDQAAHFVAEHQPDIAVVFHPDHLNGFFYQLLPSFCIGIEGTSIGDYDTSAGKLDVPLDEANELARFVLDHDVDVAISHDMQVDHGAVQPLEWLSEYHPLDRVIPVFVNCAARPLPTFKRARALGRAVGDWARRTDRRVLIIGSGGLSHDPPLPDLATSTAESRNRLIKGEPLPHSQRFMRQNRARMEGKAMASGKSKLRPANAEWDRKLLDAFAKGELSVLDDASDEDIVESGGRGGHETRTWVSALAALKPGYSVDELFYQAVDEWITGMGILIATEA